MALPPWTAAASFAPSADEATAAQFVIGALVRDQVAPEFVDVYMPAVLPLGFAAAANLVPSVEEAIDCHEFDGALVNSHVIPASAEENIGAPLAPITPDAAANILFPSA